mmetsp:Transcript_127824/g.368059  ORF Transcript_127824/g.368059 Transcript_127824/m.368059 type:complete len:137 (-) Transcript_127824:146-556(-)
MRMSHGIAILGALVGACWITGVAATAPPSMDLEQAVGVDDECAGGGAACSLSALQLRASATDAAEDVGRITEGAGDGIACPTCNKECKDLKDPPRCDVVWSGSSDCSTRRLNLESPFTCGCCKQLGASIRPFCYGE